MADEDHNTKQNPVKSPETVSSESLSATLPLSEPNADKNSAASTSLSPDEQMALYESQLKEDDWGHQPC